MELESENLVQLRLLTRNIRLVDARKARGMIQLDMARAAGIKIFRFQCIENLKVVPTEDEICKIASVLEKPIDYLFSEALLSAVEAGVFSRRKAELAAPQIISLTEALKQGLITDGGLDAVEEKIGRELLVEQVREAIDTLTPREQGVIRLRFGLVDGRCHSLEEVGPEFNVTRERIRQIEAKALRKLRHPSRGLSRLRSRK